MAPTESISVRLAISSAPLRERAASALGGPEFDVREDDWGAAQGTMHAVLVTDLPAAERPDSHCSETTTRVVLGIEPATDVDAELPADFADRELQLAVRLLAQLAVARAQRDEMADAHSAVLELAETDPLTGLPNRRAWQRRASAQLAQAKRDGQPAWLALVDLDGFKQVNDREGMHRGDELLAGCGHALTSALRRDDLVARLGGDEFGILLTGVTEAGVPEIFERLRASIAASGQVTASIGVAPAAIEMHESELLAAAERAMRAAKRAGGNRVVL